MRKIICEFAFCTSLFILLGGMQACKQTPKEFSFLNTTMLSRVTGTPTSFDSKLGNPNNTTDDYNVGGTDLGIVWEMDEGKYGILFGDTYGRGFQYDSLQNGPNGAEWRCNVLAFSEKEDLSKGITITGMVVDSTNSARELIYGAKDTSGKGDWTSIPTAAIRANGPDYIHYMNVRNWLPNSDWDTNYSRLCKSTDNGLTWVECKGIEFDEKSNFGQVAYWKKDGYVYMVGTQSGRQTTTQLARFEEANIENKDLYEYWNKTQNKWIKGDETKATNLFDDTVGELSLIYHRKYKQWVMTYFCADRYNITVRYANEINGEWSEPIELANGKDYPQLYGSYIHPQSADDEHLYFLMSMWKPYNVFLMKSDIVAKN